VLFIAWAALLAAQVALPLASLAVPACPEGRVVEKPGGFRVTIYLRGDEHGHWHEDEEGFCIVEDGASGAWVYAMEDGNGGVRASGLLVGRDRPESLGIVPYFVRKAAASRSKAAAAARKAAAEKGLGTPIAKAPRVGTMKNLVVLVQFADLAATHTKAEFEALFNTIGYNVDGAAGSVKDYYRQVSYNQLTVDSVVTDWITLDQGFAYYGTNDAAGNDLRPREMVAEALAKLEASGFNFSGLDQDNDGWVDGLTIIHAGGGEEFSGNNPNYIWSHQWALASTVTYDGKRMRTYHTEPERRGWDSYPSSWGLTRIGVICHETGHFLGLPDLYDYGYDSQGAGDFCLMAGGSWNGNNGTQPAHPSVWCKARLGWLTPTVISAGGSYSIPRVQDNAFAYRVNGAFPSLEYILIENRQGYGFDAALPGANRGLLIWHVDESVPNNDDQNHYLVDLEEASGPQHLALNTNSGEDSDYYREGNATVFSSTSTPNNLSYGGQLLGLDVTAVSSSASNMVFTVTPASVAQFKQATYAVAEAGGSVRVYVSRTVSAYGAASVNYATADASAGASTDYTPVSGTLSWAQDDMADKYFDVPIINDGSYEGAESFKVVLSLPSGVTLGALTSTTVTIEDDDPIRLTGTVSYYSNYPPAGPSLKPVENVQLGVTGQTNTSDLTDSAGLFTVNNMPAGVSVTLTPLKNETNLLAGLSTFDCLLIQRQVLGITPFSSPYQRIAADVDGSEDVSTFDALVVQQMVLGMRTNFTRGLWTFVPADYSFPDPSVPWPYPTNRVYASLAGDQLAEDFVAIRFGDVDQSWSPPDINAPVSSLPNLVGKTAAPPRTPRLSVGVWVAEAGGTLKVPVRLSACSTVDSLQFGLAWDAAVVRPIGIRGLALRGLRSRLEPMGQLGVSWFDATGQGTSIEDGAALLEVEFQITGRPGQRSAVVFRDDLVARELCVGAERVSAEWQEGAVLVTGAPGGGVACEIRREDGGRVALSLWSAPLARLLVQYTEALAAPAWQELATVVADETGHAQYLDQPSTNQPTRFYRGIEDQSN